MDATLDQVRQELSQVYEELLDLPHDAYERRAELQDRQNELRQLSHQLIESKPQHDKAELKAAYQHLHDERDRLLDRHISVGFSQSVGDAGIDSTFTTAVNKAMDEGLGLDEIEARLNAILDELRQAD